MRKDSTIDGVPVFCAFDDLAPIESITPNPRNPNTHPDTQVALLAKIISAQGWRAPITVSNRSGFVTKGHGRLLAARHMGQTSVPIDRQDYADEASEYADMIADNRIAELAEIDASLLKDLILDIDTGDIDIELTGFTEAELARMMSAVGGWEDAMDGAAGTDPGFVASTFTLTVEQNATVQAALSRAKAAGLGTSDANENTNGNALAAICEAYQ